jgi:hypothetical protein
MLSSQKINLSIISSLKKNKGMTLSELVENLPEAYHNLDQSPVGIVINHVIELNKLGLLEVYNKKILLNENDAINKALYKDNSQIKIYISENVNYIEEILTTVKSFHNKILGDTELIDNYKNDIFVLMPFAKDFKPIFEDHIKKVGKEIFMNVFRADDLFTNNSILEGIWKSINSSRIVIADLTTKNPNVFYEIGLCHAIGKDVVLIAQNQDDVPSDFPHLRVLFYTYTPRGMAEFESSLKKRLYTILEEQRIEFIQIR